ncbi:MFS transporter [Bradyrhizobium sp. U87765 SZCCT0131]|nr:MFS transporter [Bradyrhizobium sp. U87765 SZCCT0131]MBR1261128.1 MFS transporter [Bradyrhizobium sp. U87765 SZCCT0134]MBR1303424.1 MFS transporter [Bradyrhizobium sp. U87765 SZCCT0110]MBR1319030.1 MFS transporter [Bradyrhizobium sp. U87765 SZCCT0109]MBR1347355.1 MFS transporter [Bradyrhizobium sp. U87765 SZCCT0048]
MLNVPVAAVPPATRPDAAIAQPPRGATLAATIGNMLEFYDFLTYGFFAVQIGRTFFPSHSPYASLMLSLATFGAGFITRPIGGVVIGLYSDRAGRRPAMVLSFAMMGCAIVVLALLPSYASIGIAAPILAILARMVQGFSLGGEVGPTTAYLIETAPPGRRASAVAWQPASQQIAATFAAFVGLVLSSVMSHDALDAYGWRIAFLIGALTLPFGLWLRARMPESIHLPEEHVHATAQGADGRGRWQGHRRLMLLGLFVLASGTITTYVTQYMTTYAETTLGVGAGLAFATSVVSNGLGILGALMGGWLADRYGRWPVMVWPQLAALLLTWPVFLWMVTAKSPAALLGGFGLLALIGSLPFTAFYAAMTESLPKPIRGSRFAILYAVAIALFGGTAQLVVTWLIHVTGDALAPAWYLLVTGVIGLIAMALMEETMPPHGEV